MQGRIDRHPAFGGRHTVLDREGGLGVVHVDAHPPARQGAGVEQLCHLVDRGGKAAVNADRDRARQHARHGSGGEGEGTRGRTGQGRHHRPSGPRRVLRRYDERDRQREAQRDARTQQAGRPRGVGGGAGGEGRGPRPLGIEQAVQRGVHRDEKEPGGQALQAHERDGPGAWAPELGMGVIWRGRLPAPDAPLAEQAATRAFALCQDGMLAVCQPFRIPLGRSSARARRSAQGGRHDAPPRSGRRPTWQSRAPWIGLRARSRSRSLEPTLCVGCTSAVSRS